MGSANVGLQHVIPYCGIGIGRPRNGPLASNVRWVVTLSYLTVSSIGSAFVPALGAH